VISAIVTDIEGTTSSLSFVKDVLFPYARSRLASFVAARGEEPAVRSLLDEARALAGGSPGDAEVVEHLVRWIDEDRKATPLKALQGMIWREGYERGDFQGHVYDDAVQNLRRWRAQGISLHVFSSGSVEAQQLLFGHTPHGDLRGLFAGWFDTRTGPKREPSAYRAIATAVGLPPEEILFLSDVREELDAAREAGMQTTWLVREGPIDPGAAHRQVRDFDGVGV
jgi:enolase-phosphatase E1